MKRNNIQLYEAKQKMKGTLNEVTYMIDGLSYHFSNITTLYSNFKSSNIEHLINCEELSKSIKHEIVAYLNRLGQFYYFTKSQRVKDLMPDSQKGFDFINNIIELRMKQTAHRASDLPHKSDKGYDVTNLDKCFSWGTMSSNNKLVFHLYHQNNEKSIKFEPMQDHIKVEAEIKDFFEKLHSKIYEEDSDITDGAVCKWFVNELYKVMFFAEGDNRLDRILASSDFDEKTIREVVTHLTTLDWIFMYNRPKQGYFIRRNTLLTKIDNRNIINPKVRHIMLKNRERILKAIYDSERHGRDKLVCKLLSTTEVEKGPSSFVRDDLGTRIDFLSFYKEDLKDLGFLTEKHKLTETGRKRALLSK
ncbi:MAG: hypothetical protein ABJN36_12290 [Cyclobacteriaceae bacterium]